MKMRTGETGAKAVGVNEQDRLALEYLSRELAMGEGRLYEHVATTFRWLMATLFAANGAALIALVGAGEWLPGGAYAMAWLAAGVALSLVMGILSTFLGYRAVTPISGVRAKVNVGLITGEIGNLKQELVSLGENQKMTWKKWSPTYAGLASFTCFVAGIAVIACAILS